MSDYQILELDYSGLESLKVFMWKRLTLSCRWDGRLGMLGWTSWPRLGPSGWYWSSSSRLWCLVTFKNWMLQNKKAENLDNILFKMCWFTEHAQSYNVLMSLYSQVFVHHRHLYQLLILSVAVTIGSSIKCQSVCSSNASWASHNQLFQVHHERAIISPHHYIVHHGH